MSFPIIKTSDVPLWRKILRQNFTRVELFADFLELNETQRALITTHPNFPLQVPLRLAQKMPKGILEDPLVKQFLSTKEELKEQANFNIIR